MNATSQLDFHPEAESLNAFAEQALPERERGRILAHLGACSRCREVVYLALEAAREPETASAPARKNSRLGGWRLAWVPAAALAAIVGVAVWVHVRRAGQGSEMAKLTPQPVVPTAGMANRPQPIAPAPDEKTQGRAAQLAGSAGAVKRLEGSTRSAPVRKQSAAPSAETASSAAPPAEVAKDQMPQGESYAIGQAAGGAGYDLAAQPDKAQFKMLPPPEFHQSAHVAAGVEGKAAPATQALAKVHGAMAPGMAGQPGSLLPADSQLQGARPAFGDFLPQNQSLAARKVSAGKPVSATLPSGLAPVSTAAGRHRMLAIDIAGSLFVSDNANGNWEQVVPQWSGRAVTVRARQNPQGNGAVGAPAAAERAEAKSSGRDGGAVASPASPEAFELWNDGGQVWVSADGRNWKPE